MMVLTMAIHEVASFHIQQKALQGVQVSQAWTTVEWLPLCAAFYAFMGARSLMEPLPRGWVFVYSVFTMVLVIGVVAGLINFSGPQHYFGDILKLSISWGALYMTLRAGTTLVRRAGHKALDPFLYGLLFVSVFDAGQTILFGTLKKGAHIANSLYFIAFGWGLFQETIPAWISLPISALCAKAALVSWKRSNLVALFLTGGACMISLAMARRWGRITAILCGFLAVGFLMTGSFSAEAVNVLHGGTNSTKRLSTVVNIVNGKSFDSSYEARRNEENNVLDFLDKNPEWWLTGVGFGGEIPAKYHTGNVQDNGTIHHVHNGIFLYLLRDGLIGVFLLALLAWRILKLFQGIGSPYLLWAAVFFVLSFERLIASISGNFMVGATDAPILIGLGFVCGIPPDTLRKPLPADGGRPLAGRLKGLPRGNNYPSPGNRRGPLRGSFPTAPAMARASFPGRKGPGVTPPGSGPAA
jgi:hypothetical protein